MSDFLRGYASKIIKKAVRVPTPLIEIWRHLNNIRIIHLSENGYLTVEQEEGYEYKK